MNNNLINVNINIQSNNIIESFVYNVNYMNKRTSLYITTDVE